MAEDKYRRLTCGACLQEFTQAGRGRNAKTCGGCRPVRSDGEPRQQVKKRPKPAPCTVCRHCLGAIEKTRRGKIYCSKQCAIRARDGTTMTRAEYRERCRAGAAGRFTCEHCGRDAYRAAGGSSRKHGYANRWCSMECRVAQAAERERLEQARRRVERALRAVARQKEPATRVYVPVCGAARDAGFSGAR